MKIRKRDEVLQYKIVRKESTEFMVIGGSTIYGAPVYAIMTTEGLRRPIMAELPTRCRNRLDMGVEAHHDFMIVPSNIEFM